MHHGQTDLHTKKGLKKVKLFSQIRNTFHLGSLIWVSGKAENASQSVYNPLASGALSGPKTPGCNATGPQADGFAHPKRVKKGKLFSQNRNTFHLGSLIWVSDKTENASQSVYNPLASGALSGSAPWADGLAHQNGKKKKVNCFHLGSLIWVSGKAENASQSIYNPLASGALSGPKTPSPNGSAPWADGPEHPKKGKKKVNCFLKTEILFIWDHSFGSQVMAYGLVLPTSLKYTILSLIKDLKQGNFLSFFVL